MPCKPSCCIQFAGEGARATRTCHTKPPTRNLSHQPALPSLLRRGYIPRSHFMQEVFMPTEGRPETHAKNFGENIESDLALEFLRVVENAAIESSRTMGRVDRPLSDQVSTESMRKTMDTVPMHGPIVLGEGERDYGRML